MDTAVTADFYRTQLIEDILPFWARHSIDRQCGGYFTCLGPAGEVFDTDKFLWLQGRQVWTFAKMHRHVEPRGEWLDIARHGAEFLRRFGRDADGRFYFALDRAGRPIARPCIFSDCFAAMGLAEYAAADSADWAREIALTTWRNIQQWLTVKQDAYTRVFPTARPTEAMVYDMINVNLAAEINSVFPDAGLVRAGLASLDRVLKLFVDREAGLVFEHVAPDGSHPDSFAGRLVNPGHALECLWFLIEAGREWDRPDAVEIAIELIPKLLRFGWDDEFGGLYYFLDARGRPPEQLEWSQKLWWVHGEALVAAAAGWRETGQAVFAEWFERLHEYTWSHFHDPAGGEWWGYLDRCGEVNLPLKGGKWKGCFHTPRSVWKCWRILESMR